MLRKVMSMQCNSVREYLRSNLMDKYQRIDFAEERILCK